MKAYIHVYIFILKKKIL
ncbi:hypothetical protein ABM437_001803 [Campylobacter coli]|nr:hypothetical protein [Campylobacter coli]